MQIIRPQVVPYLRETVATYLQRASVLLAPYRLGVIDAWRPLERQQRIYQWMTEQAQIAYPDRSGASLIRTVNRFVAPPNRKAPPGHTTGAAVDVWLLDEENEPIDVCSPFERFQSAPTYVLGLDPEAQVNRLRLVEAMITAGFSNCRDEWWHYSYGDAGWAVRTGESTCFYDLVSLDKEFYQESEALHIQSMVGRPNPFIDG